MIQQSCRKTGSKASAVLFKHVLFNSCLRSIIAPQPCAQAVVHLLDPQDDSKLQHMTRSVTHDDDPYVVTGW